MTAHNIERAIEIELDDSLVRRFWAGVKKGRRRECWLWQKATRHGYGAIKYSGTVIQAQRVAYLIANGDLPAGITIGQSCRNRTCCNPAHLIAGSISAAGRRGAQRSRPVDIAKVWSLARTGLSHGEIANETGLTKTNVATILQKRTWKHLVPDWAKGRRCVVSADRLQQWLSSVNGQGLQVEFEPDGATIVFRASDGIHRLQLHAKAV